MNTDPIVTIAIPTFNRGSSGLLEKAIKSISSQTYAAIKVVIYDDLSTDNTEQVVSKLISCDSRISYHKNNRQLGLIDNFNQCIDACTTPFLIIFHDDDEMSDLTVKKMLATILKFPKAVVAAEHSNSFVINSQSRTVFKSLYKPFWHFKRTEYIHSSFEKGLPLISCPSAIFNMNLLKQSNLRFSKHAEMACDWLFWIKANLYGDIIIRGISLIDPPLVRRREHQYEASNIATKSNQWDSSHAYIENFVKDLNITGIDYSNIEKYFLKVSVDGILNQMIETRASIDYQDIWQIFDIIAQKCAQYKWGAVSQKDKIDIVRNGFVRRIGNGSSPAILYSQLSTVLSLYYGYRLTIGQIIKDYLKIFYYRLRNKML